jgi:rubrerythrin
MNLIKYHHVKIYIGGIMSLASVERPKTTNKLHNDLEIIRTATIAELDATSLYEAQIDNLDSEEAKKVIRHIMLEEKEHISELQCLLMKLDKEQMDKMEEVNASTCIAGGFVE